MQDLTRLLVSIGKAASGEEKANSRGLRECERTRLDRGSGCHGRAGAAGERDEKPRSVREGLPDFLGPALVSDRISLISMQPRLA